MFLRLASLVCAASIGLLAGHGGGVKVDFVGGTLPEVAGKPSGSVDTTNTELLAIRAGKSDLRVPWAKVNTLEYGQNVGRRYAAAVIISPLLLLSKSRKHFLTIGFLDSQARQQAVVFRVGKGDIRALLAALEARSGRRVEYLDADARKRKQE
jgi:hypothetical protein